MSSEIRAGDNRTYWIISNGNGYVDGVTDPNLVTTVGNGWHIYWIGSDHSEYVNACNGIGIFPRNLDNNIPTTNNITDGFDPYLLLSNLKIKTEELEVQKSKIDNIDIVVQKVDAIEQLAMSQQEAVNQISSTLEVVSPVIPGQRVSATQIRLWLIQNGINLNSVIDAINTIPDQTARESVLAKAFMEASIL